MDLEGVSERRLKLLSDVSGVFLPGVLTALMGSSGAGKTTLLDVLAGRKTGGYIEGDISISGFKKEQSTFARVAGYVEQNDIHSPQVTVIESLLFSAFLRLSADVSEKQRRVSFHYVIALEVAILVCLLINGLICVVFYLKLVKWVKGTHQTCCKLSNVYHSIDDAYNLLNSFIYIRRLLFK